MKNDPFQIHKIDHLSPSSINTFISDTPLWIMRYLFDFKTGGNPAMWRGTSVDNSVGIHFGFLPKLKRKETIIDEFEKLKVYAEKDYPEYETDLVKYDRELNRLAVYDETAINFYNKLGKPDEYQKEILYEIEDCPVPIKGFLDLKYGDVVRDIKTSGRKPTKVSYAHARQMSIYGAAENCVPILDYICVTTKGGEVISFPVNNIKEHLKVVRQVSLAIMNLLSYSNDKYAIAQLYYPDLDSWMWGENEKSFAKQIWEIK